MNSSKRYTKRDVKSYRVVIDGTELILVFNEIEKQRSPFRGVTSDEQQSKLISELIDKGIPVQVRLYSPSVTTPEGVMQRTGITEYEEVEF